MKSNIVLAQREWMKLPVHGIKREILARFEFEGNIED
jgi:hypothetical protein